MIWVFGLTDACGSFLKVVCKRQCLCYYAAHTLVREIPWNAGPGAFIEKIPPPPQLKKLDLMG